MEKTLLKNKTKQFITPQNPIGHKHILFRGELLQDRQILDKIATDLMQPRPEAVSRLMQLCKGI